MALIKSCEQMLLARRGRLPRAQGPRERRVHPRPKNAIHRRLFVRAMSSFQDAEDVAVTTFVLAPWWSTSTSPSRIPSAPRAPESSMPEPSVAMVPSIAGEKRRPPLTLLLLPIRSRSNGQNRSSQAAALAKPKLKPIHEPTTFSDFFFGINISLAVCRNTPRS